MNYHNIDTNELIDDFFAADYAIDAGIPDGFTVADLSDMLIELDRRGICARSQPLPAWHPEAETELPTDAAR